MSDIDFNDIFPTDIHGFSRILDDGKVNRISQVDTDEYRKGKPTIPGFTDQDHDDQEDRIKSDKMGLQKGKFDNIKVSPAGAMKRDIVDSIETGYADLNRGTKIRILNEIVKELEEEGEEKRAAKMKIKRLASSDQKNDVQESNRESK